MLSLREIMTVVQVIVADDNVPVRSTLRRFIEKRYAARVIAEAGNGLEAIGAAEQERPDLVILDISMPIMDGFIAAQNIKALYPDVPIIMISGNMDAGSIKEAFRCGAHGCLSKVTMCKELIPAVRAVVSGMPALARKWGQAGKSD